MHALAMAIERKGALPGKTLGQRIRAAYLQAGFNRAQFTRAIDVNPSTVFTWEKDAKDIKIENLEMIAEVCGVSIEDLLARKVDHLEPDVHEDLPKYRAFDEFVESPQGQNATPEELKKLREARFTSDEEPTRMTYDMLLLALRSTVRSPSKETAARLEQAVAEGLRSLPKKVKK